VVAEVAQRLWSQVATLGRGVQGRAKMNFGHAVVLLVDAVEAHRRASAGERGAGGVAGGALSRRELALAGNVLDEGRLLVVALNKADALDTARRTIVLDSLNLQVRLT
jgi:hypothetical protein